MIISREYHNIAFIVFLPSLAYEPLTVRVPSPFRILSGHDRRETIMTGSKGNYYFHLSKR